MAQQFAKLFEMPDGAQVLVQKLFDPEQDEYVLSTSTKLEHSHFDSRESYEDLSLIHISEPTRPCGTSRMPSSA